MVLKNGLSRMRGDPHVRFLGGGGAAMRRCYPTRSMALTELAACFCARNFGAISYSDFSQSSRVALSRWKHAPVATIGVGRSAISAIRFG